MLTRRIENFLNAGDAVAAEVKSDFPDARCFVRIRPIAKPGIPREEHRYLNSTWSMWEYWDFHFRRLLLRSGWEADQWNYDRYILDDQQRLTVSPQDFQNALVEWVPSNSSFEHISDSDFPE